MTRWLITGASGLLGGNAARLLGATEEVIGLARTAPLQSDIPFEEIRLEAAPERMGLVERTGATAVFHAAALASIEACEQNPDLAERVNVEAAADLASQARLHSVPFAYISTDAVFDGRDGDYTENSHTSPTSEYGRSKLRGERAVLEANPDALVARVNFYGWSPTGSRSLAEFFYNRLSQGEVTPGFDDISVSTLQVAYLVETVASLLRAKTSGVYHVASSERISKFEFGRRLAEEFGFDPRLVVRTHSSEHLTHARGSNLSLSTTKVEKALSTRMATQAAGLSRLHEEWDAGVPSSMRKYSTR